MDAAAAESQAMSESIADQLIRMANQQGAASAYEQIRRFADSRTNAGKDRLIAMICDCYPPGHPISKQEMDSLNDER